MHKTLSCGLLAAAFLGPLADLSAQTWSPFNASTRPSARRTGAAAFDPVNSFTLFYGGLLTGPTANSDETWAFDGTIWTLVQPATTPPPRWAARMVLDTRRSRIITFGGRSPSFTTNANDTWEWDGNDWQQVVTANAPSARHSYGMAYDQRRGLTYVFGGSTLPPVADTWSYDGIDWSLVSTTVTPPGMREAPSMAYDAGRGVTVLFGGWDPSNATMRTDTWEFDGTDWTQVVTANSPVSGYRASMVYDTNRGRLVLYGGFGGGTALQDTWEYDGNDWTLISSSGPSRSTETYMAHDSQRRQTVLFGGSGPTGISDETWVYTGPDTAILAPFGHGCPGGGGTPLLQAANPPRLGQTFQIDVSGLPASAASCLLIQGYDNTTWNGIALPLDLGLIGATGCRLEVSMDYSVTLPASGGSASLSALVPNLFFLRGAPYFAQVFTIDVTAPNGIGSMSRAVHGVIGN